MGKDRKKNQNKMYKGPDHSAPYPVSRLAPSISIVDLAKEIERADQLLNTRVSAKLQTIADQIKSLQSDAKSVLEKARHDQEMHQACCSFKKLVGHIYHLYEKNNGTIYFSMLSPQDWKGKSPHVFKGSYRLESDMSWTPKDRLNTPDDTQRLVKLLLKDTDR